MKTEEEIIEELEKYEHLMWSKGTVMLNDTGVGYMQALQWVLERGK